MADVMELHGSILTNLGSAIRSAQRLRGHPIHADTLQHWTDLLHQARRQLAGNQDERTETLKQLVADLETELADYPS